MTMTELAESTGPGEMIEPMTVDIVDQKELAEQLLEQAKEQNIELVGPGGLLGQLTKSVLETALDEEMSEHLGYEKHDPAGRNSGNSRNGTRAKTLLTEIGPVEIEVPRDTESTFEPQIVKKRQRRLTGVDEIVLSLTARGLTTGEIAAHFHEVYGARVSKDTVSRITEKVCGEMTEWLNRPLEKGRGVRYECKPDGCAHTHFARKASASRLVGDTPALDDTGSAAERAERFRVGRRKRTRTIGGRCSRRSSAQPVRSGLCRVSPMLASSARFHLQRVVVSAPTAPGPARR
jgi:hypothetical protein